MGRIVSCYGVRIGIRTNTPQAYEQAISRLPLGTRPVRGRTTRHLYSLLDGGPGKRRGVKPFTLLYRNASKIVRSLDFEDGLDTLESDFRATVAKNAPRRLFLQGSAFEIHGKVVILCEQQDGSQGDNDEPEAGAASLQGKLLDAGAIRLTTDYTPLDRRGRLTEFTTGGASLETPSSHRVDWIVACSKSDRTESQRLSKTFAMIELTPSVMTGCKPGVAMAAMTNLVRRVPVARLEHAGGAEAVAEIESLLSRS